MILDRVQHELRRLITIFLYLYVCFGALIFYKLAILHGQGIGYAPYGLAAIKAFLLAKFIMLGEVARLGEHYAKRRVIQTIASKALAFLSLVFILSIIEETIEQIIRGRPILTLSIGGGTLLEILATSIMILLVLIPYIAFKEVNRILDGRPQQVLFEYHDP